MECVSSVSFPVVVNGNNVGNVIPSRGHRQGGPLFPYLFILVACVLFKGSTKAAKLGEIKGIRFNDFCPILTHLPLTDDSLFFVEATGPNVQKLKSLLLEYCHAIG